MVALVACAQQADENLSEAALHGRRVYRNVCIACHHGNPNRAGTLGPAIAGSSLELLRARVLHQQYPPGYTPKRPTTVMPAYPFVEEKLPDLAAYLAEIQSPQG
jgi:mono/diheme cytochrome c family protein